MSIGIRASFELFESGLWWPIGRAGSLSVIQEQHEILMPSVEPLFCDGLPLHREATRDTSRQEEKI